MEENDFSLRDFLGVVGGLAGTIGVYLLTGGNGWVMLASAGIILVWIMCKQLAHEVRGITKIVKEVFEEEDDPQKAAELFQEKMLERMEDPITYDLSKEIDQFNSEIMFKIVDNIEKSDDELYDVILNDATNRVNHLVKEYDLKKKGYVINPDHLINSEMITQMIQDIREMVSDHGFNRVYEFLKGKVQEN